MNNNHELVFELSTGQEEDLILGLLQLKKGELQVNSYQATSSLPGRQYHGSWERRGGLIPPGDNYTVSTQALWMPNVPGVEGSFYQILPFEVATRGDTRGDFGVHFDANVPGSMGCIVLVTQRGWDAFRRDMRMIGTDKIPLSVRYL